MDWGKFLFSAYGRIGRGDFWILFFILLAAAILIGWIPFVGLAVLYCSICARTKRLHDMGRSGWFQIIPVIGWAAATMFTVYFIVGAAVGSSVGFSNPAGAVLAGVGGVTMVLAWVTACFLDLGFLLWIGIAEGEAWDNRFGQMRIKPGMPASGYAPAA